MSMPLLFEYFQELPQRREQEKASEWSRRFRAGLKQFQKIVTGRYTEGTLQRLLGSATPEVRQASVVALGLCGSMTMNLIPIIAPQQGMIVRGLFSWGLRCVTARVRRSSSAS